MHNYSGQFLGELEKEVMDIIWGSSQKVTVRFVYDHLRKRKKIAYTTVMTIMGRLVDKGLLKRDVKGKAYNYFAAYSRDKFLTKATRQIIKNLISNFGDTAIAHFTKELEKVPADKKQKLARILRNANGK